MPWLGLLATLAWNYHRHRHGRSTICSTTRDHVPPRVAAAGLLGGFGWLFPHVVRGYPRRP